MGTVQYPVANCSDLLLVRGSPEPKGEGDRQRWVVDSRYVNTLTVKKVPLRIPQLPWRDHGAVAQNPQCPKSATTRARPGVVWTEDVELTFPITAEVTSYRRTLLAERASLSAPSAAEVTRHEARHDDKSARPP